MCCNVGLFCVQLCVNTYTAVGNEHNNWLILSICMLQISPDCLNYSPSW